MRTISSDPKFGRPNKNCVVVEVADDGMTMEELMYECLEQEAAFRQDGGVIYLVLFEIHGDRQQRAVNLEELDGRLSGKIRADAA